MSDSVRGMKPAGDSNAARIALVTGANKGIGFAVARQLGQRGSVVVLGARDEALGRRAADVLADEGIAALPLRIDVTDPVSVAAAAEAIEARYGRLDILVNNAGIAGGFTGRASEASAADLREVYETNVFGVVTVTRAMLPLLRRSAAGRVVNLSSHVGSLTLTSNPASPLAGVGMIAYQSSKTALNAITVAYANELRDTPIRINVALPGVVATDINHRRGHRTAAEGAAIAVRLALLGDDCPSGACLADEGPVPW